MSVAFDSNINLTVEAAFGYLPFNTAAVYTDISAYVRGFTTNRGRSNISGQIAAGTGSIILDNATGRFDPSYTSGAYYPNIKPMVPVRISAAYTLAGAMKLDTAGRGLGNPPAVGTAPVFTGFAEAWTQQWPGDGVDAQVEMRVTDGIKLWNLAHTVGFNGIPTGYALQNSTARVLQLLVDHGWPAAWVDGYAGAAQCLPQSAPGAALLSDLRKVESTEGGLLFLQADGHSMFHPRAYRDTLTAVATFGDNPGELPYTPDAEMGFDDHNIWNVIWITTTDTGVGDTAGSNSPSIDSYGRRDLTINDTLILDANEADLLGQRLIARFKDPHLRLDRLHLKPKRSPALLWPVVLTCDLGTKFIVKRRPPAGNTITLNVYLEGIRHDADALSRTWDTTYQLSQYA